MEVPGKLGDTDSTLVCLTCDRDGIKEPAYGFCQDCQEHLCESCYKNHRRPKPLRNHVLLEKDSMPKIQTILQETQDDAMDLCDKHHDKPLEFYCKEHKALVCYVCVTLAHKQCQVDYIPEVSGNISDEMNDLISRMELLNKKCLSNIRKVDTFVKNLEQSHENVVKEIHNFRKEINEHWDRMEATITREAAEIKQEAKCKLEKTQTICAEIIADLQCLRLFSNTLDEENTQENKQTKNFIEMKNAEKRLSTLTDKEKQEVEVNQTNCSLMFTKNIGILDILKKESGYGLLSTCVRSSLESTLNIQHTDTINGSSDLDEKRCNIIGIHLISPSKMIVADGKNHSIKLIDIETKSTITENKLSSSPADVITHQENKIAVTLPRERCIQIMSYTMTGFSLCHRILVGEKCNGVAYWRDKFVVSCFASKKIIILTLAGEITNVLDCPASFTGPIRLVISNDGKFLYISDTNLSSKNMVVKIDWEGNIKNEFKDLEYIVAAGIQQLEDETLLVCYRDSDTILRLSSSLKKCEITGLDQAALYSPKALTYCSREQKLYVGCSSTNSKTREADVIKIFNVEWII